MIKIILRTALPFCKHETMAPKRNLSAHQKQIRFFIGLSIVIIILVTILIFWLLSRPKFGT
jgi:cell division septal protein FtsQ